MAEQSSQPDVLRLIEAGMEGAASAGRELAMLVKSGASQEAVDAYFMTHGTPRPMHRSRSRAQGIEQASDTQPIIEELSKLPEEDIELVRQLLALLRERKQN